MKDNEEVLTALAMIQLSFEEFSMKAFEHEDLQQYEEKYHNAINLLDDCLEYLSDHLLVDDIKDA